MVVLCGTDIVHISKIREKLNDDNLLKRFFHQSELTSDPNHLAGIIAAKEAFFKALGKIPKFLDIKISYEKSGRPFIVLPPNMKLASCDVSISHDGDYAVAVVLLEK